MTFNDEAYQALLSQFRPRVINDTSDYRQALSIVALFLPGEKNPISPTPEEVAIAKLFRVLIAEYEMRTFRAKKAAPHEILQQLMKRRGLKQVDIAKILGQTSKGNVSSLITGRRTISTKQAKALGDYFHVSPGLFI